MTVYHVYCRNNCKAQPCCAGCSADTTEAGPHPGAPSSLQEGWKQMGRENRQGKHKAVRQLWFNKTWRCEIKCEKNIFAIESYLERCSNCPAGSGVLLPLLSWLLFQPCGLSRYAAWQPREVSLGEGQAPHGLPSRVHQAMTLSACTWHLSLLFLFWEEEKQLSSATVCEGGRWGVNSVVIVLLICLAWKWRTHDRTTRNKHGGWGGGMNTEQHLPSLLFLLLWVFLLVQW